VIAGRDEPGRQSGDPGRHEPPDRRELGLVSDAGIRRRQAREAEAVEREVRDHDRGDQRQDQDRLAVGLETAGLLHEAPPEAVGNGGQDRDLDCVLERRERAAGEARIDERLVVADRDQLDLAREQREEAQEQHRVHQPRTPVAADHARLQEAVAPDVPEASRGVVPARVRREARDDGELAPRERGEARESREQLQTSSHQRICRILKSLQTKMQVDASTPTALQATERFLYHLASLKALMERKSQIIGILESAKIPRLNAHELLLLMFNSILRAMCREEWYAFSEDAPDPMLPSNDELSLATTI